MAGKTEQMIARVFGQIADGLETGSFGARPKIALTGMGSEHGEENAMAAAREAARAGVDVYYIGTLEADGVTTVKVKDDEEGHQKMEELLKQRVVDGAVTMHYPFPIGVSTVGRAVTPGLGREMFIANTTGTSSTDRTEGMIRNALAGIITAKACGNPEPTIGILNVDGARQTEMALQELQKNGYPIRFAESSRASGAPLIRDALKFAAELVQGKVLEIAAEEYQAAKKAGLEDILKKYQQKPKEAAEEVTAPPKEVVTGAIQGIEIMDLEDGVRALWKQNIYAESGMGCTGPVILVSEANCEKAEAILKEAGFIS